MFHTRSPGKHRCYTDKHQCFTSANIGCFSSSIKEWINANYLSSSALLLLTKTSIIISPIYCKHTCSIFPFNPLSLVLQTCGGVIRENSTYFVNPNHPDVFDGTGSCQVTVQKLHPDICQLRLDLDMFSIAPPEAANHLCNQDQLLISGGSPTPTICGSSTGDHSELAKAKKPIG